MKSFAITLAAGLAAIAAASSAEAATYLWSISGNGFTGSGMLVAQDTPYTGAKDDPFTTETAYLVTSFTGTMNSKAIQSLYAPDPNDDLYGNDNLIYPNASYPYIDLSGLAFKANNKGYSLFNSQVCHVEGADTEVCDDFAYLYVQGASASKKVTFTLTAQSTASVPEPASWAMMIGGFGMVGAATRRGRAKLRFA